MLIAGYWMLVAPMLVSIQDHFYTRFGHFEHPKGYKLREKSLKKDLSALRTFEMT